MADPTKVPLVNLTERDLIDCAAYMKIPQANMLLTAFDGGLVNIQQLIDSGNTTIAKYVTYMTSQIDPFPARVREFIEHLNMCRMYYGNPTKMIAGSIGPVTGIYFNAQDVFQTHLEYIRSLVPIQVDESFITKHTSFPSFVRRGS